MVCWLALCLGRKVEERLGKECQGATRGGGEEEGKGERRKGKSYRLEIISDTQKRSVSKSL